MYLGPITLLITSATKQAVWKRCKVTVTLVFSVHQGHNYNYTKFQQSGIKKQLWSTDGPESVWFFTYFHLTAAKYFSFLSTFSNNKTLSELILQRIHP